MRPTRLASLILVAATTIATGCQSEGGGDATVSATSEGSFSSLDPADLETASEEQKTVYALGVTMAQSVRDYGLSGEHQDFLLRGVADGLSGEIGIDPNQYQAEIRSLVQSAQARQVEEELTASSAFVADAAGQPGAVQTDSGLVYIEEKAGEGESPNGDSVVRVHYHGTLRDGTVFDSSVDRGEPATFPLNRVVRCWQEALIRMKVGGKSRIVCPSDIAYGNRGAPPHIKPGAALAFDVELIEIVTP